MNLSRQIRLGFTLMLLLMLLVGGLSIYNVYKLNETASNLEGRYDTLYKLFSGADSSVESDPGFGKEMVEQAIELVDEQITQNYTYVLIVVGVALLFGGIITVLFPAKITRPILNLVNATKTVKQGDYSYRIMVEGETDEISTLANSFNEMLHNIEVTHRSNVELIEQTKKFNETLREKVDEATREIREQQNELIKAERLATIGEFAARIAHEIKNPLSGISVALELLKSKSEDSDQEQSISEVQSEVKRLDNILKDLLQLSIPKEMEYRKVDPNDIVERSVLMVKPRADERGVEINMELNCEEECTLDYEKCQQVVMNLLINAIDAVDSKGGKVTVTTNIAEGSFHLKISDTGQGIPKEMINKIFDPFYSGKKNGTGLGLPISKKIVEAHNGRIEVFSEEGKGATFTVIIPKASDHNSEMGV